jgi:elongator complex protein 3
MSSYVFNYTAHQEQLLPLLKELESVEKLSQKQYFRLLKRFPRQDKGVFSKDQLIQAYRGLAGQYGLQPFNPKLLKLIQMKPVRTGSGVTPLTVLTKPFPCPGQCIFCPNDVRMPKSYLSDEPGAQRAERNYFDPYLQTYNRLQAFHNIGHPIDKVELLILGGTWSFYPEPYQIWFIKECFRALNEFSGKHDDRARIEAQYQQMEQQLKSNDQYAMTNDPLANKQRAHAFEISGLAIKKKYNQVISEMYVAPEKKAGFDQYQSATWAELKEQQRVNETAGCRSVGLVIETRPDNISPAEVIRIRRLGCTKTQIGVQSLNDLVLTKNNRGHQVDATRKAFKLLRQAGFKIHAHWMANLYGSSVEADKTDFLQLFADPDFHPDELKIYPCSLIASAELMQYYQRGEWQPYTYDELLEVVSFAMAHTPEYCRLTRVIRDIPSTDIVEGNKLTNFRQVAEEQNQKVGSEMKDIRAREIRHQKVDWDNLELAVTTYQTSTSMEHFLQVLSQDKLVGFLRLSLPSKDGFIDELDQAAIIREIHVYGPAQQIGKVDGKAQHRGVGAMLITRAKELAQQAKYSSLAVISAVGTRDYYRKHGFVDGQLYQILPLAK